jgi:hypothetical protein
MRGAMVVGAAVVNTLLEESEDIEVINEDVEEDEAGQDEETGNESVMSKEISSKSILSPPAPTGPYWQKISIASSAESVVGE